MKHRVRLNLAALKVDTFETEAAQLYETTIIVMPDTGPDDTWHCGCCRNGERV
jgi:hypothetical protein